MNPEPKPPQRAIPSFEVWKLLLRNDCERQNMARAFDSMGDYVLKLFWERGLEPTAQALLDSAKESKPN